MINWDVPEYFTGLGFQFNPAATKEKALFNLIVISKTDSQFHLSFRFYSSATEEWNALGTYKSASLLRLARVDGTSFGDSIYWLAVDPKMTLSILTVNMENKGVELLDSPKSRNEPSFLSIKSVTSSSIGICKEKLTFVHVLGKEVEKWDLVEGNKWHLTSIIGIDHRARFPYRYPFIVLAFSENILYLLSRSHQFIYYDLESATSHVWSKLDDYQAGESFHSLLYGPSLTPLMSDVSVETHSSPEDPSGVSQKAVVTHPGSSTGKVVTDSQTEELPKLQYSENFPRTDFLSLNHIAGVTSMDFHPTLEILLVGTQVGDVDLWNIAKGKKIAFRNFQIWNLKHCPVPEVVAGESSFSVNKVRWSADGLHFGITYSKYLVHVYRYLLDRDLQDHLEINAHDGCVNDVAFYGANEKQCFVTCGDDKTVKAWNASTGERMITLNHQAPVFSVLPYQKDGIDYIYSVSNDGKINVWNDKDLEVAYDAPRSCCTRMSYSTDGSRLFSCGTTTEGSTHLVEWDERKGFVKRTYGSLKFSSSGMVHFDTFQDHYLAAGNGFAIKIWDMDNPNILVTIVKDGLPANPCLKFNNKGSLLAVALDTGAVHVLATRDWINKVYMANISKVGLKAGEHSHASELGETSKIWPVPEITELSQCRAMKLNDKTQLIKNVIPELRGNT